MKPRFIAAAAFFLLLGTGVFAHRLDEYLQAALISVEADHLQVSMRLVPGVAVSSAVVANIDTNGDGIFSPAEQKNYAERVLRDLSLTVDGKIVRPALVSETFPPIDAIKEGLGEIQIEFTAALSPGGPARRIVLENHHHNEISAYLVNCLVPRDPHIRILAQTRNESQSFYQLDFAQAATTSESPLSKRWTARWTAIRARVAAVGFVSIFRLGMRHIAEGPDHLLFLLALLLPAPLLVNRSRWAGFAGVRQSIFRTLKVVTAFTAGHSLTLALAALGLVHVPSRPIEVLIAFSILISAIHAIRPLFPGREALIAAFFGLIHGLAFAATLGQLGLGRWDRVAGILAFNLGIETMQLIVVAATIPSLVLMSRTRAYHFLRMGGALFAGFASLGWIADRLFGFNTSVDRVVGAVAQDSVWIALCLFGISVVCWSISCTRSAEQYGHPVSGT